MSKEIEKFAVKKVVATEFFTDLSNVMTPELQSFIKKYMTDRDNSESLMLMIKTYDNLSESYFKQFGKEPEKEEMAVIMTEIMNNINYRKILVGEWESFIKGKSISNDTSLLKIKSKE